MISILIIGNINSYAAFPTFVWTEEYKSELYAVEMTVEEAGVEEIIVFDTIDDEPATPTDIEEKEPAPDEGMNITADDEIEEPDTAAQSITSYDIEPTTAGKEDMEPPTTGEEDIEPMIAEDNIEPAEEQQEENTEPEQEG